MSQDIPRLFLNKSERAKFFGKSKTSSIFSKGFSSLWLQAKLYGLCQCFYKNTELPFLLMVKANYETLSLITLNANAII